MLHPRIKSLKKLFQLLMVIFGCLHLTGGPHALVQSYAWISMIIQYSKNDGIAKGVKDTFSGERPCHLCKKIDSIKKDESKQPLSKDVGPLVTEAIPKQCTCIEEALATLVTQCLDCIQESSWCKRS